MANAARFGASNPALRTTSRIADLAPNDLAAFCDWEACVRTNGYGHACWVNDAGWERCKVCDGSADCAGRPLNQADCLAHANDSGRAQCHVGLLQECLLEQALRGPADPRVTKTCQLSDEACAGGLPGDLSAQALAAQHETDQTTVQTCEEEVAIAAQLEPGSTIVGWWQKNLSSWEGGLPSDIVDASAADGNEADGGDL